MKNPPTLNVIPATSWGCFGIGPCWDLGVFQAIIYISSEHNVSKNNKNQLFSTVLRVINKGDLKRGGGDKNPPTLNIIPETSLRCFGIGPCWDLDMFQAIIKI